MSLYRILQDPKECRGYLEFLDPPGCHWVPLGPPGLPLGFPGPSQLLLPLACFSCLLLGSSMASPQLSWLCLMPQLISVLPRLLWAPRASLGQVSSKQSKAKLTAGPMRIQGGPGTPQKDLGENSERRRTQRDSGIPRSPAGSRRR